MRYYADVNKLYQIYNICVVAIMSNTLRKGLVSELNLLKAEIFYYYNL